MREVLETSREVEYFTRQGLRTLTGLDEEFWAFCVFKELLDNALDAINELSLKHIDVCVEDGELAIYDSGGGIQEAVIDNIFDFKKYVSSKRDFRTPTRGFQGNALKTIIGICYLEGYELYFLTNGKQISYTLNSAKINVGIVDFKKKISSVSDNKNGVIVKGVQFDVERVKETIWTYYLCNPDVNFTVNDSKWEAIK